MLLDNFRIKKRLLFLVFIFLLFSISAAYAEVCEVAKAKDVLKKNLYLYLTNPSSSPLTLAQVKDLLVFYIGIPQGLTTVDCSASGSNSNTQLSNIVSSGENASNIIPSCSDGTKYGECSSTKPKYCYGGSLINKCQSCGCPSGNSCNAIGECTTSQNIACFSSLDCGNSQFTGSYYCSNNYVTRNYLNYTCMNSGTTNSNCVSSTNYVALNYCNPSLNQSCVNGNSFCNTSTIQASSCTDTDNGLNYNVKGIVTAAGSSFSDYCGAESGGRQYVIEQYCDTGNNRAQAPYLCGGLCSDGACIDTSVPCVDSDSAKDYYMPGSITKGSVTKNDYCGAELSGGNQYMFEQYCNASGAIMEESFVCPTGCDIGPHGACINASEPCIESDGGINFGTKGSITKGKLSFNDYCALGKLVELYCENGTKKQEVRICSCSDGACPGYVDPPNICTDSDNGLNYYVQGSATKGVQTVNDGCGVGSNLFEAYCDANGNLSSSLYVCPAGCGNGACINETLTCIDSDGGLNYNVRGTVTKGSLSYTDYCGAQQANGSQYVLEQYCDASNNIQQVPYLCPGLCSNGNCLWVTPINIRITDELQNQYAPRISGNRIVWTDERNDGSDVYMYNILTGQETLLTPEPGLKYEAVISGSKVVYILYKNTSSNKREVILLDLDTSQRYNITTVRDSNTIPAITGNIVLWTELDIPTFVNSGLVRYNLIAYDLQTSQKTTIVTTTSLGFRSYDAYGNKVVWLDRRYDDPTTVRIETDLYVFDLVTGQETRLSPSTFSSYTTEALTISGNKVVTEESKLLYVYDISTGQRTQLPVTPESPQSLSLGGIDGNRIVYYTYRNANWDIYMFDLLTNQETAITTEPSSQQRPDISGNTIVWQDRSSSNNLDIFMKTLS